MPAFGAAMDVGVDGKGGNVEGLGHHYRCGFMAHSGQLFQIGKTGGNLSLMLFDEDFREVPDRLGLCRGQSARTDDLLDFLNSELNHPLRAISFGKE
jgi:hypothetical protein